MTTASEFLASQILVAALPQTNPDAVATFTGAASEYIPLTSATETSNIPTTVNPIATSPTKRAFISYSTDNMGGVDVDTYLFGNNNVIGKQVSNSSSVAFFTNSSDTLAITSGHTFIIDGVTATAKSTKSSTLSVLFADIEAYLDNNTNTNGTDFTLSGTPSGSFKAIFGYPVGAPAWALYAAVDALHSSAPPSKTGTGASITRTASTGNGVQKNKHSLHTYFNAAGVGIKYSSSLGIDDTTEAMFIEAKDFHVSESTYSQAVLQDLNSMLLSLKQLTALNLGEGEQSVADVVTAITDLKLRVTKQNPASRYIYQTAGNALIDFNSSIKAGEYLQATDNLKLVAGDLDGNGFVSFTTNLADGASFTILGLTVTNSSGAAVTPAQIATVLTGGTVSGLARSGTITSGYIVSARNNPKQVAITKASNMHLWSASITGAPTGFKATIVYPLETVFETSTTRSDIQTLINAMTNTNEAATTSFTALKNSVGTAWTSAKAYLVKQDSIYNLAASAVLADLATFSTDTTYLPHKLVYVYTSIELNDEGLVDLQRCSLKYIRLNETGTKQKLSLVSNAVATTVDITIPANQVPTVKLNLNGEPLPDTVTDATVISFAEGRLKLLPEMKPGSVTFLSLVELDDDFIDGNVTLQELQLNNFAGITATRILTATANAYRLSADAVQRKFNVTVLDENNSEVVGAILDYKALVNKPVKFKLTVGTEPGFIYDVQFNGTLTNQQAGQAQNVLATKVLEVTVASATITLR